MRLAGIIKNITQFISLTSSKVDKQQLKKLKSTSLDETDSLFNPLIEEFANLNIVDELGNQISFYDLATDKQEKFLEEWSIANAVDMTPKLNDSSLGEELEEYVQIQNDAFDEAMEEFGGCDSANLKSAFDIYSIDDMYNIICEKIQQRVKEKSEEYSTNLLRSNPNLSKELKSVTEHTDYIDPEEVLEQLRSNANRGDILINLPGSVWLSAYLFYYNPLAISKYVGIGKYPPGHVAKVKQTKTSLPSSIYSNGVTISAQNGSGVRNENVNSHWDCKARLCYVKQRKWVWNGWKSGYKLFYPNADNVISYAESKIGKPYCSGWDFVTAKGRTSCFICTTITWRSFKQEDFNIHRIRARWMPTIAPADILLSSHVVVKHKIK